MARKIMQTLRKPRGHKPLRGAIGGAADALGACVLNWRCSSSRVFKATQFIAASANMFKV
jgi:hypothetical protein